MPETEQGGKFDVSSLTAQGMWSDGSRIFKAFSKQENSTIKTNYIGKWELNSYSSATYIGSYSYTDTSHHLFEIESISATSNQMYAAVKTKKNSDSKYGAALYRIKLKE